MIGCSNFSLYKIYAGDITIPKSISKPGKTGIPQVDLSNDTDCTSEEGLTGIQQKYERVIAKRFSDHSIPLVITPAIRTAFKCKLWRMGKCFSTLGTKNRSAKLETWKTGNWQFSIPCGERCSCLSEKEKQKLCWTRRLPKERNWRKVTALKEKNVYQQSVIKTKKSYLTT